MPGWPSVTLRVPQLPGLGAEGARSAKAKTCDARAAALRELLLRGPGALAKCGAPGLLQALAEHWAALDEEPTEEWWEALEK